MLIALIAGALSATGFAPLGLWPVAVAGFAVLAVLAIEAPGGRAAFGRGWAFGVGHFSVGLNWIAHAFTFQDAMPHWLGYPAVVLLSLYLAVFPGLAALGGWAARRAPVAACLAFAAAWMASEWLRATVFTGFAWNPLAAVWLNMLPVARTAAWIGTLGLSGLTALAAAGIGLARVRRTAAPAALAMPLLLLPLLHLGGADAGPSTIRARIIQPNVGQEEKNDPRAQVANLKRLVAMSGPPGPGRRLLLWPEAAIDNGFLLEEDAFLREWLSRTLGPDDMLLTGGVAIEYDRRGNAIGARNSVFALGPDARIRGRYDKAHLVPYGEYLPMRPILSAIGLSRLVPGDLDFWPGPGPRGLLLPGFGRAGFQICYEIIFSGQVVDGAARPDFLFNPSNDAWFGSWGPPQHLAQARLRAIEEGVPVLRATPTGISAVIAPDGRLLASRPLGTAGVIDAVLPRPLDGTPFARLGNMAGLLLALAFAALAVVIRPRAR
jgi:apolipoprotein N-acyltransferase